MPRTELMPLPEFQGSESYPDAIVHLMEHASTVGGVIIRRCFDPTQQLFQKPLISHELTLPDAGRLTGQYDPFRQWWADNGPPGTSPGNFVSSSRPRSGGQSVVLTSGNEYKRTLTQFASLRGVQRVFLLPGVVDYSAREHKEAEKLFQQKQQALKGNRSIVGAFSHEGSINCGDVVFIAGWPRPPIARIVAERRSSYAEFSRGMSKVDAYMVQFVKMLRNTPPRLNELYHRSIVAKGIFCLNSGIVVVPMQPCAAHSANTMDGQKTTDEWVRLRETRAWSDSYHSRHSLTNQGMLCNKLAKAQKTTKMTINIVTKTA